MGGLSKKKPKQKKEPVMPIADPIELDKVRRRNLARQMGSSDTIMSDRLGG